VFHRPAPICEDQRIDIAVLSRQYGKTNALVLSDIEMNQSQATMMVVE
jgi:hypothetical protein